MNIAGSSGEQSVIVTAAHIVAGVEMSAALTDDDLAGLDELTAKTLNAQTLSIRIAAVAGGTKTLLVCHSEASFS